MAKRKINHSRKIVYGVLSLVTVKSAAPFDLRRERFRVSISFLLITEAYSSFLPLLSCLEGESSSTKEIKDVHRAVAIMGSFVRQCVLDDVDYQGKCKIRMIEALGQCVGECVKVRWLLNHHGRNGLVQGGGMINVSKYKMHCNTPTRKVGAHLMLILRLSGRTMKLASVSSFRRRIQAFKKATSVNSTIFAT